MVDQFTFVDGSNYSRALSAAQVTGLRDAGITAMSVQAIDPPPGYPVGVTRQQIQALLDDGILPAVYVWKWFGLSLDDTKRRVDLLSGYEGQIWRLAADVEDTTGGRLALPSASMILAAPAVPAEARRRLVRQGPRPLGAIKLGASVAQREDELAAMLEYLAQFPTIMGALPDIYTGLAWYWGPYMGNTTRFAEAGHVVWNAQYDDIPDVEVTALAGGWSQIGLKQYQGDVSVGGVDALDINVARTELFTAPALPVEEPAPEPTDEEPAPDAPADEPAADPATVEMVSVPAAAWNGMIVTLAHAGDVWADYLDEAVQGQVTKEEKATIRTIAQGLRDARTGLVGPKES